MSTSLRELICGSIGGLVGSGLCYPIDTIKTRIQAQSGYSLTRDLKTNGPLTLWKGLASPLTSIVIEKSLLFSSFHFFRHNQYYQPNAFQSGILAGILTTLTVTPFERVKTRAQTQNQSAMAALREIARIDGFRSIYRGWSATLFREVPGYGLYFWAYEQSKQRMGTPTPFKSFVTGSISGVTAWIIIYPSDPVKTIMQDQNVGARVAVKKIWNQYGIRGFYRGYVWGLARAAILHGGVFLGYESALRVLN